MSWSGSDIVGARRLWTTSQAADRRLSKGLSRLAGARDDHSAHRLGLRRQSSRMLHASRTQHAPSALNRPVADTNRIATPVASPIARSSALSAPSILLL